MLSIKVVRNVMGRRGRELRGVPVGGCSRECEGGVATVRRVVRMDCMFYCDRQHAITTMKAHG
jgi:hypothetical protein